MKNRDHHQLAPTPPMGWNSWDCYGASITEAELLNNARFMAEHLRQYGWEYIVIDTSWYEPAIQGSIQVPFADLEMDNYGRLVPAANRFPSSFKDQGLTLIADQIHEMGLKFGLHIMRGIPRQAVHRDSPVYGSEATARQIADPSSVCSWNSYMYGVDPCKYGAYEYYKSIFELYASWGVDFIKLDDASFTGGGIGADPYSAQNELDLIRQALNSCGRKMVLSLSPGPAPRGEVTHLASVANMWRISADFWDDWKELRTAFDYCRLWEGVAQCGAWPDCDMLPIGRIGVDPVFEPAGA